MDRGAWRATVLGEARAGHDLVTERTHTWRLKNTWRFWWKQMFF